MAPIELIAIATPYPGQAERFLEMFGAVANYVRDNEPYVFRYELHKGIPELNDGKVQFFILEGYDDQEAMDKHLKTHPVVTMVTAMHKEKIADVKVIRTQVGVKARM